MPILYPEEQRVLMAERIRKAAEHTATGIINPPEPTAIAIKNDTHPEKRPISFFDSGADRAKS